MKKGEKRAVVRYPYKSSVNFTSLGYRAHPPERAETTAEIMDLSDSGLKIRMEGRVLEEGNMLRVRIPIAGILATVPTLAQVIWTKRQDARAYQAGLRFVVQ